MLVLWSSLYVCLFVCWQFYAVDLSSLSSRYNTDESFNPPLTTLLIYHSPILFSNGRSHIPIHYQGHLFFGNVQHVVEGIENALKLNLSGTSNIDPHESESSSSNAHQTTHEQHIQYRFLILDCSFITGADVNAVAGLLKLKSKMTAQLFQTAIVSGNDSIQRDLDHLESRTNSLVQVHVLFAGLQDSMEAMFALQGKSLFVSVGFFLKYLCLYVCMYE